MQVIRRAINHHVYLDILRRPRRSDILPDSELADDIDPQRNNLLHPDYLEIFPLLPESQEHSIRNHEAHFYGEQIDAETEAAEHTSRICGSSSTDGTQIDEYIHNARFGKGQ